MTFSIETTQGTYKVELNKQIVFGGAVEFHSTIKMGRKVVGRIGDFRQAGMGFAPIGGDLIGLSEWQAIKLHTIAIAQHKAQ
jgi:hypothetical protein